MFIFFHVDLASPFIHGGIFLARSFRSEEVFPSSSSSSGFARVPPLFRALSLRPVCPVPASAVVNLVRPRDPSEPGPAFGNRLSRLPEDSFARRLAATSRTGRRTRSKSIFPTGPRGNRNSTTLRRWSRAVQFVTR